MDNTVEQRRARRGQRRRRRRTRRGRRGGLRLRRPLPRKSVTKPLTIPFLRGMEGVFSAAAQRAICAAHLRATEIEQDLCSIAKKLDVVGMCKHVCAQRRAALLAAGKAKQMAKPMSSAFGDAQLAAAKLKWQAIYFTYLNRIVESFAVSDVKLSAIIGPLLFLQLVAGGFDHNGLRVVGRRQPLSAEGKATKLILAHFRRRVQAMRGAATSFSVRTLYVPFAEGTVLSQRNTNARGAFVDVKNGDVQVLYLPDRVRVEQVVYRDERAEDCESDSFEVRGGADNADENDESDFDHVAAEMCDLIVGRVAHGADVDWPITGVFMTAREHDSVVDAVGGVSLERIGAVDPGAGLLVLGRVGTRLAHAVKTNQPPFTISKKQKKKSVVQRQAQKRFRADKLEKVAERALRALTLDGVPIDTLVCGDGFRNKSTRNSKRLGGFGHPALLMDAVDVKTAFCTEVFTTRVRRDTSGRFVLLQRIASFLPKGHLPSGRVVARLSDSPPTPPPDDSTMRASLFCSYSASLGADGAVAVEPRAHASSVVRECAALRGRVVEAHVLDLLREWRGDDGQGGQVAVDVTAPSFKNDKDGLLCGTGDALVRERDNNGDLGAATVVEVKSTMRTIDWSLLLSWFCQIQVYLHLYDCDVGQLVVKSFSPCSPYVKSGFRVWTVSRLAEFSAIGFGLEPTARAPFVLRHLAERLGATVQPLMREVDIALSPIRVARALASHASLDTRQLRANIGATLKANIKTPLVYDTVEDLLRSFLYAKRGVLWDPVNHEFVGRDASAAQSIAFQAHSIGNGGAAMEISVRFGSRQAVLGHLVASPLAAAAAADGYDMKRYVSFRNITLKRKVVYALKKLCNGNEKLLRRAGQFNWQLEATIVGSGVEPVVVSAAAERDRVAAALAADAASVKDERSRKRAAARQRRRANAPARALTDGLSLPRKPTAERKQAVAGKRRSGRLAGVAATDDSKRRRTAPARERKRKAAPRRAASERKRQSSCAIKPDDDASAGDLDDHDSDDDFSP